MAKAIVHIGFPKTGTTSLQVFLAANRDALAKSGVIYMKSHMGLASQLEWAIVACTEAGILLPNPMTRHVHKLRTLDDQRAKTAKFEANLVNCLKHATENATFVISCEQLGAYLRTPDARAGLDRYLRRHFDSYQYVAFARPMDEYLLSIYSEAVKLGNTLTLDEFVAQFREKPMAVKINEWAAQFPGQFVVRMKPKGGIALFEEFCDLIGVPTNGLVVPEPQNTSLTKWSANVLRVTNGLFGPAQNRTPRQTQLANFTRKMVHRLFRGGQKLQLTPTQIALIELRYPRDIKKLVAQHSVQKKGTPNRAHQTDPAQSKEAVGIQ